MSGRVVRTLLHGVQPAGDYTVTWDGRDDAGAPVASGVYFYLLATRDHGLTRKMVLMK